MKTLLVSFVLVSVVCCGCASWKSHKPNPASSPSQTGGTAPSSQEKTTVSTETIVTPDTGLTGKVKVFNEVGRFVVLNFPIGHMLAVDQQLFVYRQGVKIGDLKVTGPQNDDNIVADLVSGEAQPGDEVRDK